MTITKTTVTTTIILLVAAFGYLTYLDSGCELVGVMTVNGKVCIN